MLARIGFCVAGVGMYISLFAGLAAASEPFQPVVPTPKPPAVEKPSGRRESRKMSIKGLGRRGSLKDRISKMIESDQQDKTALRHFRNYHQNHLKLTPEQIFDKFDINGNGSLSRIEFLDGCRSSKYEEHNPKKLTALFKSFDLDSDNALTKKEFAAALDFKDPLLTKVVDDLKAQEEQTTRKPTGFSKDANAADAKIPGFRSCARLGGDEADPAAPEQPGSNLTILKGQLFLAGPEDTRLSTCSKIEGDLIIDYKNPFHTNCDVEQMPRLTTANATITSDLNSDRFQSKLSPRSPFESPRDQTSYTHWHVHTAVGSYRTTRPVSAQPTLAVQSPRLSAETTIGDLYVAQETPPWPSTGEQLANLKEVTGSIICRSNKGLEKLVLPALERIGGELVVEGNHALVDIEMLNLKQIGRKLLITSNDRIKKLAFPKLNVILHGDLTVCSLDYLESLQLPALKKLTGSLEIYSNRQLKELSLAELVFIEQDLKILDNGMLQGIDMPKFNGIDGEIKGYSMISTTPQFHGNAENFQVSMPALRRGDWKKAQRFNYLVLPCN